MGIGKERLLSNPEQNHERVLRALQIVEESPRIRYFLRKIFEYKDARLETSLFGLRFTNPVGLAAGFDKNCQAPRALGCLGFGHIELGTVTPLPQKGNSRPRIWRLSEDRAVINWMGMPNVGLEKFVKSLQKIAERNFVLGINIGKNEDTPLEEASGDYDLALRKVHPYADYIALNVSSPNTPELRRLQRKELLDDLVREIKRSVPSKPVLLKIDPDLSFSEIDDVIAITENYNVDGIIATNTTVSRENLRSKHKDKPGGLSGLPLREKSTTIIRYIYHQTEGAVPLIGVGGVFDARDALEKIRAGASLVQVYTGFVLDPLKGPFIARNINKGLSRALESEGIKSVRGLVGSEAIRYRPRKQM